MTVPHWLCKCNYQNTGSICTHCGAAPPKDCEHMEFSAAVEVARMPEIEGGPVKRFSASVRIVCMDCGLPFRFIGLPCGVDLNGAAVSIDATEARIAIAPKGEVVSVLEGGVAGFSVRREF